MPILINSREEIQNEIINKLDIAPFYIDIEDPEFSAPKLIKITKPISQYRWAGGISTSRFFSNPFLDFDEAQDNEISTKYGIVNLSISIQTGKRSNITTGISVLNSTINVRDDFSDTYSSNQPSESLASNIARSSKVGALTINDNESSIMIEFLPDITLSNGDQLTIKTAIPLKLKAYSIPFSYKRQFLLKKFTPYLMGGISVDLFEIKIEEIFLDIRHLNQTVHKPVVFEPISETEIVGSIYLGFGSQYNFSDRWYGEAGLKIDMFDTKFTTIEAGIYYRF